MRFQVMKLVKACPSSVTNDIRNVVTGVRRWTERLRGKGNDHEWSDFMVSKFQHHTEEGSYNRPLSDIEEIGDRVLQWGSHLDKKRVELRQYFPPSQTSNNPSTSTYGPTGNEFAQRVNPRNVHRHHGIQKRPHTVQPLLVHRLRAQNHVRTVVKCIHQAVPCVHIQMLTRMRKFHGRNP